MIILSMNNNILDNDKTLMKNLIIPKFSIIYFCDFYNLANFVNFFKKITLNFGSGRVFVQFKSLSKESLFKKIFFNIKVNTIKKFLGQ